MFLWRLDVGAWSFFTGAWSFSQFILPLRIEKLKSPIIIRLRDEHLGRPAKVAIIRRGGIGKRLRGGNAVFLEHHHQHLGIDDGAGVKKFHAGNLLAEGRGRNTDYGMARRIELVPLG